MTDVSLNDADQALIAALRANARATITELAAQLGAARTTVQARMDRLERQGIIAGYTIRLGEAAESTRIRATVLLQLDPRAGPAVVQRLRAIPQVERAVTSSGRFDLVLQLSAATTARLDELLDAIGALPGVKSSESLIHLSTRIDRGV